MVKSPFERIFSKIDRKKIFQKVIKSGDKIYLKTAKNQIIQFQPMAFTDELVLKGQVLAEKPKDFEKITALFYVERERYFLITRLKKKGDFWELMSDHQFFRLNRRAAFRTNVPVGAEISLFISTIRNIEFLKAVRILEISSGGARIHWNQTKRLAKGTTFKGAIQWGQDKVIPVDAVVVHQIEDEIYGVKFTNMNGTTQNRVKLLSIELQMEFPIK